MAPAAAWRTGQQHRAARSRAGGGMPLWGWLAIGGGVIVVLGIVAVVVVVAAGVGKAVSDRVESRQAVRELEAETEAMRQRQLENLDNPEAIGSEEFDQYLSTLESKSGNLHGEDAQRVRVSAALLRSIQPQVQQYQQALRRLLESGGVDPTSFKSKADIDSRLKVVAELRVASDRVRAELKKLPDRFREEMKKEGVSDAEIARAVQGFRSAANMDLVLQVQDLEVTVCDVMTEMLKLFKTEWGRWRVNRATGRVEFDSNSAGTKYTRLEKDLNDAAEREVALQRRLLTAPRRAP